MTPTEFKEARHELGLSIQEFADIANSNPDTVRKWEMDEERSTARPPNPVAVRVMEWLKAGWRPPQWPQRLRGD